MKFMIRCDIEGASGITAYQQADSPDVGRNMLMNDLNACIDGLLCQGEHKIVVYDQHGDGRNVRLENLPQEVSVICGRPPCTPEPSAMDRSFDALLLLGFHARAGVTNALLAHSYNRSHTAIRINGSVVGEIGLEAALSGEAGVPVWLVTGDSAAVAEAETQIPGVRTVSVKDALGPSAACCLAPALAAALICEAAERLVTDPPQVAPLAFPGPVVLEVSLEPESDLLEAFRTLHPELFADDNTVRLQGQTVGETWSWYLEVLEEAEASQGD